MAIKKLQGGYAKNQAVDVDICVIGGGIAGLIAAVRLAEKHPHFKVVVLESGDQDFDHRLDDLNRSIEERPVNYSDFKGRARILGGTSTLWGGRMLPLREFDVNARTDLNVPAWPIDYAELNRYQSDIERMFDLDDQSFEESLVDRIDNRDVIPGGDAVFAARFPKWPVFRKCNVAKLLRANMQRLENLDVWVTATVTDIKLDALSGRVVEVIAKSLDGVTLVVRAREFLLATGTLEATRLMLVLNESLARSPLANCRALGKNFNDHLGVRVGMLKPIDLNRTTRALSYSFVEGTRRSVHFELNAEAQRLAGIGSGFAQVVMHPEQNSGLSGVKNFLRGLQHGRFSLNAQQVVSLLGNPGDLFRGAYWRFVNKRLYWPRDVPLSLNVWIEQLPQDCNFLALANERDALGMKRLALHWNKTDSDEKTFRVVTRLLRDYWTRSSLDRICEVGWMAYAFSQHDKIIDHACDLSHPAGSLRMGLSPRDSVVNADLQSHVIANLSVASAAVFPSSASANPTYTIIQLALRAADKIAERLQPSPYVLRHP